MFRTEEKLGLATIMAKDATIFYIVICWYEQRRTLLSTGFVKHTNHFMYNIHLLLSIQKFRGEYVL